MAEHDVEAVWHDFWVPVLDRAAEGQSYGPTMTLPRGFFDQIKRELFDYHALISKLPAFFDDITGGRVTKPNTDLNVVREFVDERIKRDVDEALEEAEWVFSEEERDKAYWSGYDKGHQDGRDRGFEDGLDEARNRI